MVFFVTIILLVYGGANVYIARRLYQWFNLLFQNINSTIYACIFIVIALSIVLGFSPVHSGVKKVINWISAYWMGIFVYLLIFCLAADCVVLLGSLVKIIPKPIPPSVIFFRGLSMLLLTIGVVSYSIYNANQIKLVNYDVSIKDKKLSDDIKIVLISDLHLGAVNSENNLEKIVRGVNSLEPDIVCIAGDIFNGDLSAISNPSKAMRTFLEIETKNGVYASLGNHDGGSAYDDMVRFLSQSNIKLLNDECEIIEGRVLLIGRMDRSPIGGFGNAMRADIAGILSVAEPDMPIVVMDHNPARINQYGPETDLILSGHTHRGQLFPGRLITHAMFDVDYGYRQKGANSPGIVVTSGAGTWGPPMRVGSSNEIVCITLH